MQTMIILCRTHYLLISLSLGVSVALPAETSFKERAVPLLKKYCYDCHDDQTTKGNLDLTPFLGAESVVKERKLWLRVLHQVESQEMPPKKPFPAPEELQSLVEELDKAVNEVDWSAFRNPGHVPLARLSQLQYRNSVRDLLGIDFNAGLTLPRDPEGPSGFRNDRSSLLISGSYLEQYYAEARRALDALFFLKQPTPKPQSIDATSIKVFRARIDKDMSPPTLILPTESATGSSIVVLPETGYYRITVRAATQPYPLTGLNLYADGNGIGSIIVNQSQMQDYTLTALLEAGSNLISLRTDVSALPARNYLLKQRREDFLRQFSRKLLGYALGRSAQLSDRPLIDKMIQVEGQQIGAMVDLIVQSPQFREVRGKEFQSKL